MSKLLEDLLEVQEQLEDLKDQQPSASTSNDTVIQTFDIAGDIKSAAESLYYGAAKPVAQERAKRSGLLEDGIKPVLEGDTFSLVFYDQGHTEVNEGELVQYFGERIADAIEDSDDLLEAIEGELQELIDLIREYDLGAVNGLEDAPQGITEFHDPDEEEHKQGGHYKLKEGKYENVTQAQDQEEADK